MARLTSLIAAALVVCSGCTGEVVGSAPREAAPEPPIDPTLYPRDLLDLKCDVPSVDIAPMRRLSHNEYRYVVEDLFKNPTAAKMGYDMLVRDPVSLGYSNSASLLDVKSVLAQQYMEAATKISETLAANIPALLNCDVAQLGELACAKQFIRTTLPLAYRRPVTPEELTSYESNYQNLRTQFDFRTGIEWIVATVLQAPEFLYRAETDVEFDATMRPVRPYEMASRLSFLIWHSIPDAQLLAAAESGSLSTTEDLEREAKRMLADPRGRRVVHFFEEWMDLDKLGTLPRSSTTFPNLDPNLATLFRAESTTFIDHVLFQSDASLKTMLTADFTFANDALSRHYGMTPVGSATFTKVPLPPSRRGLWMQGGPLTGHDKETRTSIVHRGLRVRTALLCQNIPSPPDNVNLMLPPVDSTASQADRLAQHRADPACSGCHSLLDPVGQVFENVNAVGRLRSVDEGGHTIDTRGEITATSDADGPVVDAADMLSALSESNEVRSCVGTQLFRYTHGRQETSKDACSRKQAYERFAASGFDVRELVLGVVTADAFRFRMVAR